MITGIVTAIGLYIAWKVLKMGVRVALFLGALALLLGSQLQENPTATIGLPSARTMYSDFVGGLKEGYRTEISKSQQATKEWLKGDLRPDELMDIVNKAPKNEGQELRSNLDRQDDPEFLDQVKAADAAMQQAR